MSHKNINFSTLKGFHLKTNRFLCSRIDHAFFSTSTAAHSEFQAARPPPPPRRPAIPTPPMAATPASAHRRRGAAVVMMSAVRFFDIGSRSHPPDTMRLWDREKMVGMANMDDHERKIVMEFVHLLEKSKQLFNGLRWVPPGWPRARYVTLTCALCPQGPAPVRPQAVAGVLWPHLRHLHQAVEVPAAAPPDPRHQVRAETLADRGDRLQDRAAVLPLLVSTL